MRAKEQAVKKTATRKSTAQKELQVFTDKAGLFKIAGIGKSKKPGGFSWRKHEITI